MLNYYSVLDEIVKIIIREKIQNEELIQFITSNLRKDTIQMSANGENPAVTAKVIFDLRYEEWVRTIITGEKK